MGKSSVRSLPPLVYGRLAGVFEFAVEKVDITEKIVKNENCNLLVKIIWWGETKPLFVRPKKTQFITKENKEVIINEPVGHSVKYEVHTNLKLFKSYLEKCEVVELVIVNSTQNEVIGSSFLQDLIHLVFNTQFYTNPIINHSGDSIGEITCQFLFKEASISKSEEIETNLQGLPIQKWSAESLKINLNPLNSHSSREENSNKFELGRKNNQNCFLDESFISNKNILDDFSSHRSSNMHYNSPVAPSFELKVDSETQDTSKTGEEKIKIMTNYSENSKSEHLDSKKIDLKCNEKSKLVDFSKDVLEANLLSKQAPILHSNSKNKKKIRDKAKGSHLGNKKQEDNVIKSKMGNYTHSTKIVNSKVKSYIENKVPKNKNVSVEKTYASGKTNRQSIINSKSLARSQKSSKISSGVVRPTGNIKTFTKVSKEISKLNKLYLDPSKVYSGSHSDLEKVPVKETANNILGDNHQDQHSFVEVHGKLNNGEENINITESRENNTSRKTNIADYKSGIFDENKKQNENLQKREKINIDNKLYFDLNDPVEKIYYETFFGKTESVGNNEFEIAELLNQPENKYILEVSQGTTFVENAQQNDRPLLGGKGDVKSINNYLPNKDVILKNDIISNEKSADPQMIRKDSSCIRSESIESVTETSEVSNLNKIHKEYKSDCHRCKYYKKLSELDKIIDALKIFETRLKNDVVLSSQSLNVKEFSNNILEDHSILPRSNSPAQIMTEYKYKSEHSDEERVVGEIDGSDFSKEDSDFIEFTHYLSQR